MFDFFSPIEAIRRISPQKAGRNIEEAYGYLLNDFTSVAKMLEEYYPLELMKLSLWDERKTLNEKSRDGVRRTSAVLLPVLLQSVLSSTHFTSSGSERNVSERDWSRLKNIAEDVTRRLIRLIENRTALASAEENFSDEDAVNYREIITRYLLPEEMTEEKLEKDSVILKSLLEEKVELEEKTGVDYLTLSLNIDNIARKGLGGIDDLCARVQAYRNDYDLAVAKRANQIEGKTEEEVYRIITKANGWEGRAESLASERDGFDMFCLSSLSDLKASVFGVFSVSPGTLDLISFIKMGYWPSLRFPFIIWKGDEFTFVGKHMPRYIALTSSFNRRRAAMHDVLAIFYRVGIDTYTYDGNNVDISVLPSFFDRNLFTDQKVYASVRKAREDERAVKGEFGHKRLIVDPDQTEDKKEENGVLTISSAFMARAAVDRTRKRDLLSSLLGDLDLPKEKSEYSAVDEDELDNADSSDEVIDDTVSDEFEYDTVDEDEEARKLDERDENVEFVEYEKKDSVDIQKEEEKYSLTDDIIRKEEEIEKEEEKYESALDDDIFDDSEEEERLDEIGEKENSDYYEEIEEEPVKEEAPVEKKETEEEEDDDGQLDFFSLLDEEEEEEKALDEELEKDDEEEFKEDEKKAENLEVGEPTIEDRIAEEIADEEVSSEEAKYTDGNTEEDVDVSDDGEEEIEESVDEKDADEESDDEEVIEVSEEEEESDSLSDDSALETADADEEKETKASDEDADEESEDDDVIEISEEEEVSDRLSNDSSLETADVEEALSDEEEEIETSDEDDDEEVIEVSEEEEDGDSLSDDSFLETADAEEALSDEEEEIETSNEDTDEESDSTSGDSSIETADADAEEEKETSDGEENEESEDEDTADEKSLDVNSWMSSFLGLDDVATEEDGEEDRPSDDANLNDDSFVLPRMGMITEEKKDEKTSDSEKSGEIGKSEEEKSISVTLDDEVIPTPVGSIREVSPRTFTATSEKKNESPETVKKEAPVSVDSVKEKEPDKKILSMEDLDDADEPVPLVTAEESAEEDKIALNGIVADIYNSLCGVGSVFRSFVKEADDETLEELEGIIHNCWSRMQSEQKDKLFNVADFSFSILLSHDSRRDDLRMAEFFNNVGGVMYARDKSEWTAVIVYIDSNYALEAAFEKTLTKESFSPSDWKRVTYIGEQMRKR